MNAGPGIMPGPALLTNGEKIMITLREHLRAKGIVTRMEMISAAKKLRTPEPLRKTKIVIRDEVDNWPPEPEDIKRLRELSELTGAPRQKKSPLTVVEKGSFVQVKMSNN